ncbi:MAG TPA: hypothetical protein VIG99_00345 [Myxococcaceae bacterium]|jgi:hypothetical protein
MHAVVIAAFAVSAALGQGAPAGSNQNTPPPPPPAVEPVATPPPPPPMVAAETASDNPAKQALIASEGDARWGLVGVSTAAGLSTYGWLLPTAFGVTGGTQFAGAYMLTAAASFFVPFALTLNTPATWGMANMLYGAASHGPFHGFLAYVMLSPDFMTFNGQQVALSSLLFGAAEIAGAMLWANYTNMTAGTAHAIIVGADIGAGVSYAVSIIILASLQNTSLPQQVPAGLALAGSAAGVVAGSYLGPMLRLTWGDAELLWISTLLGAYVTVPFVFWATPNGAIPDARALAGLGLLGAAGGATAGYFLLQGVHLELGQAILIDLGAAAGGLLGLGTALVLGAFNDQQNGSKIVMTSVMVGAVGGYAVSYFAMKSQMIPKKAGAQVQVTFNPMALADVLAPKAAPQVARMGERAPPALALVGSF